MATQVIGTVPTNQPLALHSERWLTSGAYRLRLATHPEEVQAACRLRFQVFNLELNEGLEEAYLTGEDRDDFDAVFDHLLVEHLETGRVVGTYRLQTGTMAARNLGYYSEQEFDFTPYESLRPQLVELGRACIQREHRSFDVLMLLWRGIAQYADVRQARYLIGCCSLTSQDPQHGSDMYYHLAQHAVREPLRTIPQMKFAMPLELPSGDCPRPPKLLRTYLAVGARICGPPAIDREFRTIDFLTLMDLHELPPSMKARLLG